MQPGDPAAAGGSPQYGSLLSGARPLWKERPGGRTIFRMPAPLILWWAWVAFALATLVNLVVSRLDIHALQAAAVLLLVTGVMYACTLHARVESDAGGVTVYNPLLEHRAPWGAVEGIYLGDSVEFHCIRPAPKKVKKVYTWALYSRRRARARAQMQPMFLLSSRRMVSPRAPSEAAALAKQPAAQVMAAELGRRATDARERGAPAGFLRRRWSWLPLTAIGVPAALLVVSLLVS
jgi:hypothetical protein